MIGTVFNVALSITAIVKINRLEVDKAILELYSAKANSIAQAQQEIRLKVAREIYAPPPTE